jgi:hypothetical protein
MTFYYFPETSGFFAEDSCKIRIFRTSASEQSHSPITRAERRARDHPRLENRTSMKDEGLNGEEQEVATYERFERRFFIHKEHDAKD